LQCATSHVIRSDRIQLLVALLLGKGLKKGDDRPTLANIGPENVRLRTNRFAQRIDGAPSGVLKNLLGTSLNLQPSICARVEASQRPSHRPCFARPAGGRRSGPGIPESRKVFHRSDDPITLATKSTLKGAATRPLLTVTHPPPRRVSGVAAGGSPPSPTQNTKQKSPSESRVRGSPGATGQHPANCENLGASRKPKQVNDTRGPKAQVAKDSHRYRSFGSPHCVLTTCEALTRL